MDESILSEDVAAEVVEIFNYLEKDIYIKIPNQLKNKLNEIRNRKHGFKFDISKKLKEQEIMPETEKILTYLFLKYCCTKEEKEFLTNKERKKEINNINKSREKIVVKELFKDKKIEENHTEFQLVKIEEVGFYKKILNKIKTFFKRIFKN